MKKFIVPEMEIVYFNQKDIISTSTPCFCVDCPQCPAGSDDCPYYDTCPTYNQQ